MKIINYKYGILVAIVLFAIACTTQKNTSGTRAYHNLTSHYNILFNGVEAYKKGMLTLQQSYKDDYSKTLPVFLYNDKDQLTVISSDMDRAIKKATKLITMHSVTVKPELDDDKVLTEKERDFYNKSEYNKWVDNAYLLIGKSHLYKHEFDKASQTFQYILTNYPESEQIFETKLWMAKLALFKNRLKEAEEIIESLEKDINFPKSQTDELYAIKAELALKNENYQESISFLKTALESENKKYFKQRYNFIIAQLYQNIRQYGNALVFYKNVIKLNPPYEMTFNARINLALSFESGAGTRRDIEKQLQKMLRDDKNIDYRDQIYYAWGNLYLKSGDKSKAVEYFKKAAALGKKNQIQLSLTYLTLADIFYERPEYIPAQSYYDSAVGIIDVSYPGYTIIYAKSISLTNLVEHINTVELQDSVQKLTKLSKEELYTLVDNIIEDERKAEEEAQRNEQERLLQESYATQQQFELQNTKGSSWYFYNPTSLNLGRKEFRRVWGIRKLEDNWRRKNKSSLDTESLNTGKESTGEEGNEGTQKEKGNKYSRSYYLSDIPFTDSAMEASHGKIKTSLFEIGNIYYSDLKDFEKAENAYHELLKRYPDNQYKLQAYYKLYSIGKETENKELVSKYKQKIVREYPNSNYAKVLSDPDYFNKIQEKDKQYNKLYENAYEHFENQQFVQAVSISKKAIEEYPDKDLTAYFEYIIVVSEGIEKDTIQFINDLQAYMLKYPDAEQVPNIVHLIKYLQTENPDAAYEQKKQEAKIIYSNNLKDKHYTVVALQKVSNANQLMFNIINYNIDNFEKMDLKIIKAEVDKYSLLLVNPFSDASKAMEYYHSLIAYNELWRDVNKQGAEIFVISQENFEKLKKENNLESYVIFFEEQHK